MKKILPTILVLAMLFGLCTTAFAADLPFTDVHYGEWYYNDVKTAYEGGLINGKSATIFAPGDNLTYAEAIKLAACMYQAKYEGKVTLKNGNPWYQSYVDYAKSVGIIAKDYA